MLKTLWKPASVLTLPLMLTGCYLMNYTLTSRSETASAREICRTYELYAPSATTDDTIPTVRDIVTLDLKISAACAGVWQ